MRGISAPKLARSIPPADAAGMSTPLRIAIYAVIGVCLIFAASRSATPGKTARPVSNGGAQYRLDQVSADRAHAPLLSAQQRARTFTLAPGTTTDEQRVLVQSVASARPRRSGSSISSTGS